VYYSEHIFIIDTQKYIKLNLKVDE